MAEIEGGIGPAGRVEPIEPAPVVARWEIDTRAIRTIPPAPTAGRPLAADLVEAVLAGTRVFAVNRTVELLVGGAFRNVVMRGRPIGAFWPAESRDDLAELILAVAGDSTPGAVRMRAITSLLLRDAELTVRRSAKPDRMIVEVKGLLKDERSHWALRASEERYRKLIHHLPFALLQVDTREIDKVFRRLRAEGVKDLDAYLEAHPELVEFAKDSVRITEINRGAALLFGDGSEDRLIGPAAPLFEASPHTARRLMVAHFEGRRSYSETTRLLTLDGRLVDVRLSVTYPMPPEQADVTLIGLEDISDRLRTEAQLRQLQADFSRAARISMLGELAASIAHEVSQPLAAILANAEASLRWLSRDDRDPAKIAQLTTRIVANAHRASDVVQRVRGMAAKPRAERVALDLNEVVAEALLFVRHDLEGRSVDLSLDMGPHLSPVQGDRVQLQQVVVNLLINAIQAIAKAGSSDGRIDLTTAAEPSGGVSVAIRDSGPGIAEANLDRIFDSFFTTREEGMGMGLGICRSIIDAHGGVIRASNHADGGALFRFTLPATVAHRELSGQGDIEQRPGAEPSAPARPALRP